MTLTTAHKTTLTSAEYAEIETAIGATVKGRAFLRDHLRRNRPSETESLLRSISRLHRVAAGDGSFASTVRRELPYLLRNIMLVRASIPACWTDQQQRTDLTDMIHGVESALLSLIEAAEDAAAEGSALNGDTLSRMSVPDCNPQLFQELYSIFATDRDNG